MNILFQSCGYLMCGANYRVQKSLLGGCCPFGGTKPNPEPPIITPLVSIGASAGGSGNTTGPTHTKNEKSERETSKSRRKHFLPNSCGDGSRVEPPRNNARQ